jgi:long-chain acyl-CoA synthetase
VALLMPNTPFFVIAYYAVLRAGGVAVNCNPLYTLAELEHVVGGAGAEILITLDLKVTFDKAEALVRGGHVRDLIVAPFLKALPPVKAVLFRAAKSRDLARPDNSPVRERITLYETLLAKGLSPEPVEISADDIAVQQNTGGTTGVPKGAMLSHANVAANMSQIDAWADGRFYPPHARILAVLPFFHIFAMTVCMNVPLCNGALVIMLPRYEQKMFLAAVRRTQPTILPAVPTLIHALSRLGEAIKPALASISLVISGGAALPLEVRAAWARVSGALLAEGYGLTEASPVVCCAALKVPGKPLSVGQPLPHTDIRFVDVETGKVVGIGQRGEVQVKGPQVMAGYFRNDDATAETFDHGWLRTGDVGFMDEDGYVFLVDRLKDIIICSGFNVYPRVIEEALLSHPGVAEVNVIGVPDSYRGEAPVAYVKPRAGNSATESEMRAFLADKLNKLEQPREVIFRADLPKTLVGKHDKKELRRDYESRTATSA